MKKFLPAMGFLLHRSSVASGARLATEHCGECHDLTDGKTNKEGPYIWGIVNRRAASIPGFDYSEAFRRFAGSRRFAWSESNLDLFIADPDHLIPGTRMAERDSGSQHAKAFAGIQDLETRRELIAYLRTLE